LKDEIKKLNAELKESLNSNSVEVHNKSEKTFKKMMQKIRDFEKICKGGDYDKELCDEKDWLFETNIDKFLTGNPTYDNKIKSRYHKIKNWTNNQDQMNKNLPANVGQSNGHIKSHNVRETVIDVARIPSTRNKSKTNTVLTAKAFNNTKNGVQEIDIIEEATSRQQQSTLTSQLAIATNTSTELEGDSNKDLTASNKTPIGMHSQGKQTIKNKRKGLLGNNDAVPANIE